MRYRGRSPTSGGPEVLTVQFNLETDLPQRMAAHEEHERPADGGW